MNEADLMVADPLDRSVDSLGHLSVRLKACLYSDNIKTVRDLINRTERSMMQIAGFGLVTLTEVKQLLYLHGLQLLPPPLPLQFPDQLRRNRVGDHHFDQQDQVHRRLPIQSAAPVVNRGQVSSSNEGWPDFQRVLPP